MSVLQEEMQRGSITRTRQILSHRVFQMCAMQFQSCPGWIFRTRGFLLLHEGTNLEKYLSSCFKYLQNLKY